MKKNFTLLMGALALVPALASARSMAPLDYPRIYWDLGSQQVIFPSGNYSRIIPLQDGRLMAVAEAYGATNGIWACYSTNNGDSWGPTEVIAPNTNIPNAVPDHIQLSDGTILVGYNPRPSTPWSEDRHFGIRLVRSTDNGETWSDPIYVYDASWRGDDGCWEPSFLEMPDGEVHCYFANEHPYTTSGEQEISLCRSFDKGLTWSEPERVCFRAGHRDGMPSAIITDNGEIVVIVEDNGYPRGFRATTMRCSVEENWHDCWVDANSPNRNTIFASSEDMNYISAAPYLRKLPSGYTIASWQGDHTRLQSGNHIMSVAVGNKDAKQFKYTHQPFAFDSNEQGLWNSVNVGFDNAVFALSSISGNGGAKITMIKGLALTGFEAKYGTPTINGTFTKEDWTRKNAKQVCMGVTTRMRSNHDFLYDDDNLYFFSYVVDKTITTDKVDNDGVYLYLDTKNLCETYPYAGEYRLFFNVDGTVEFSKGDNGKWVKEETAPEGINMVVKPSKAYYMLEVAIPWSALGFDKAPVGDLMRAAIEVRDRNPQGLKIDQIQEADPNRSYTWPEFSLVPRDPNSVETVGADAAAAAKWEVAGGEVNLTASVEVASMSAYTPAGVLAASAAGATLSLSDKGLYIICATLADGSTLHHKVRI